MNYEMLPEHMRDGMRLWIERGILPGHFLTAVLCNDLMGAFSRADATNAERLKDYALFLYNDAPGPCHGSPEKVRAWAERGGLLGKQEAA